MITRLKIAAVAILLLSGPAHAVEYYELEVYGYQTAAPHELEIENTTSMSSDDRQAIVNRIVRSSLEFNFGVTEHLEATAYVDYTLPYGQPSEYTAFRAHVRSSFFEKGELPVDLGAYFEVELPRNFRQEDVGFEFRPIFEKDFSRWTVRLNPMVELAHRTGDLDDTTTSIDTDGDITTTTAAVGTKKWQLEWGLVSSVMWNMSESFRPHLDWHVGFTDGSQLLLPAIDTKIAPHLYWTLGAGFGLNNKTEQRLLVSRLEYEIYF